MDKSNDNQAQADERSAQIPHADDQNSSDAQAEQFDVVSIGDIVTDDFIKLNDDQAWTYVDDGGTNVLAMKYGMKLPFADRKVVEGVGNASNAAVSFARLNLRSSFVTNVGGDQYGRDMIAALHKNGVDTRFVRVNPDKQSNYHFALWYKDDRTLLIKHVDYEYHWPHLRPKETPTWVYFSSVSEHSGDFHGQVADWLEQNPNVKLAFQPGTYQMDPSKPDLKRLYARAEVLILNREEAVIVGGGNHADVHDLINHLHALGPKTVVVTDGPAGAYASDGEKRLKMPLYPDPKPPYERTGAGDAFASTFVAALMKGLSLEEALRWAPINSMNVVQYVGAQEGLLNENQLKSLLQNAPEWYKPSPF
ncbi:MAG TPA: carbohydrate kinase family protein [Candidatus Saccharimonadales bacterium]